MTHIPPDLDPQHIADDAPDTITVCAACRQAACWEGEIQCEDYRTAPTIEEIRELCEAATKGPWTAGWDGDEGDGPGVNARWPRGGVCSCQRYPEDVDQSFRDAIFIAHAREDVPFLLDEVERLRENEKNFTDDRDSWRNLSREQEQALGRLRDWQRDAVPYLRTAKLTVTGWVDGSIFKRKEDAIDRLIDAAKEGKP